MGALRLWWDRGWDRINFTLGLHSQGLDTLNCTNIGFGFVALVSTADSSN